MFKFKSGFPHGSVGKESTCNAGDLSLISGSGRSTGEGIGYPFQYSWASLVAQLVKNPPAMQETWVWFLGWEDPLEKGKYYPLQYSGLKNSNDYSPWGHKELDTTEQLSLSLKFKLIPQTKFSAKLRAFSKSILSIFKFLLSEMSIFFSCDHILAFSYYLNLPSLYVTSIILPCFLYYSYITS